MSGQHNFIDAFLIVVTYTANLYSKRNGKEDLGEDGLVVQMLYDEGHYCYSVREMGRTSLAILAYA